MRRREFMGVLGGCLTGAVKAHAQPKKLPVVGFLHPASPDTRGIEASVAARRTKAARRAADVAPIIRDLNASGASLRQIGAELTRRGIATPRGHESWSAVQVKRVLERANCHV